MTLTDNFLRSRGVPESTIRRMGSTHELGFAAYRYELDKDNSIAITSTKQTAWYELLTLDLIHRPCVTYVAAQEDGDIDAARQLALRLLMQACDTAYVGTGDLPSWIMLTSGYEEQVMGNPRLVVLDNIYEDAPAQKVDKLRTLLNTHTETTFVIITQEYGNPLSLVKKFRLPATFSFNVKRIKSVAKEKEESL